MPAIITLERADSPDARTLIAELEAELTPLYPAESRHGYSVERLLAQRVHFFLMRENTVPVGCGGVQFMGWEYAEVKRMYVRPAHRRTGFARHMLQHLIDFTRSHGIPLLRLETGIHQHGAIRLYERMGFSLIPPFGDYREDPLSRFYEKRLDPPENGWRARRVSFEND
jgi:putative acetyltransferase